MRPKTPVIRSKKWFARSFHLKVPMRTISAEVLKADTVVTTTGELTKSRWFVCVKYPVRHRRGTMYLEDWVRRKDLLNPDLTLELSPTGLRNYAGFLAKQNGKTTEQILREWQVALTPLFRPS